MSGRPRRPAGPQRGAASLLVVACVGLLLVLGSALGVVAAIVVAHRGAQSAADLAALAGAEAHRSGGPGCEAAEHVALANDARLTGCTVLGDDLLVTVEADGPRWLGQRADPVAQARAGPGA